MARTEARIFTSIWDDPAPAPVKPSGRHRPKVSNRQLAAIRLAVYERDSYACVRCGWMPVMPTGPYFGDGALCGPAPSPGPGEGRPPSRRLAKLRVLELDHIVPYSKGGAFTAKNLQALCSTCNSRKGASC